MIELLRGFPENVVAVSCTGQVTRKDYDTVLIPALEKALKAHEKVRLLYEAGPDFDGVDAGAAWEDFKIGMEHYFRWERVAVITDVEWIKHAARLFSFAVPGAMRVYPTEEAAKARLWITQAA
ncbi:MAG: STAS/SEC14 domain-containing protein [Methyloceanibacter sp.]|uniref:STAS/SEC14 domain-containing protein n=1 Tax=Methyloceanibacter sp. TaxID=1965321 RepID=UPI003D6D3CFB